MPAEPDRDAACAPAISTSRPTSSTRRWRSSNRAAASASRIGRPARQRRRHPAGAGAARRRARHGAPTRPRRTTRQRLSAEGLERCRWERRRENDAMPRSQRRRAHRSPSTCARCWRSTAACRRSTTATTSARSPRRGRGRRLRLSRLRAGLHPAAVLPRHRPVPLGRAVRRPRGHLPHRCQGEGAVAGRPHLHAGSTWRASASTSRGCRRASAGSVWAIGTGWDWPSTRWWRKRRTEGAHRHRSRPSRLPARSRRPTARPKRCETAPMRCRTGRC